MFYTYIIYSKTIDSYYVGASENINERLKKHKNSSKGFTNRANDWEIVYSKEFSTKQESLIFEKQIKSWKSRKMIEKLLLNSD